MSMLSRFLALRGKSQILTKNVRFLYKLGWRTSQNLVIDSLQVATASRQFIVSRVSFLKQDDNNAGLELQGIEYGAGVGQPPAGALDSLPQSIPLQKRPSSTISSDADNCNRQIKKFRNSRDILQFVNTWGPEKLSLSSLNFVFRKLFKWLKHEKSITTGKTPTTCILASFGMQKLCRAVKKHSCNISPHELITICGLFVYLNAPGDHPTFDIVLRLLLKHASSLTLRNICFLHSLLNQMSEGSKSLISEEITQILPVLFECQLSMRLDDTELAELVGLLKYAVQNNYSESVLKTILKSIGEKQTQLTYKQARKIVSSLQSLVKCRPLLPGSAELLQTSFKILTANTHLLNTEHLNMLSRICGIRSSNSMLDHFNSKYSSEAEGNRLIEAYQDKHPDTEDKMQIALDSFKYSTKNWNKIESQNSPTPPCRHCAAKRETLFHVLSGCHPNTAQLRRTRDHEIRSITAKSLREAPSSGQRLWKVEEDVEYLDEKGFLRRVHIFCYDKEQKVGYLIFPTVRFEKVNTKKYRGRKKKIQNEYKPCSKYFKDLYALDQVKVIGFSVGARGLLTRSFENFRTRFGLSPTIAKDVAVAAIRGSTLIVEHHLYSRETDLFKRLG